MASLSTKRAVPPAQVLAGLRTVPSSAADLVTTDTTLFQLVLANKTAGAVTVTVLDRQTSAKTLLGAVSIAANTTMTINFQEGVLMKNGINWVASAASSIDADILAFGNRS